MVRVALHRYRAAERKGAIGCEPGVSPDRSAGVLPKTTEAMQKSLRTRHRADAAQRLLSVASMTFRYQVAAYLPERRFAANPDRWPSAMPLPTGETSPPPGQHRHRQTGRERPPWTTLGRRSRFLRGVAHAQDRFLGHLWRRQSAPPWSVAAFGAPRCKSLALNRLPLVPARLPPLRVETPGGSISTVWSEHTLPNVVPLFVPPCDQNSDT